MHFYCKRLALPFIILGNKKKKIFSLLESICQVSCFFFSLIPTNASESMEWMVTRHIAFHFSVSQRKGGWSLSGVNGTGDGWRMITASICYRTRHQSDSLLRKALRV